MDTSFIRAMDAARHVTARDPASAFWSKFADSAGRQCTSANARFNALHSRLENLPPGMPGVHYYH